MMLFTQVTRCPHCQTSFRVGDEQLEAANGYVRCGSCLQVFNATEYFVGEREEAQPAPQETLPAEETSAETVTEPVSDHANDTATDTKPEPQSFAFTFADDEPEPEPEPEPEQPTAKIFEFEPLSPSRAAQQKSAVANHLIDLSEEDHEDTTDDELDLEDSMLISDDGIIHAPSTNQEHRNTERRTTNEDERQPDKYPTEETEPFTTDDITAFDVSSILDDSDGNAEDIPDVIADIMEADQPDLPTDTPDESPLPSTDTPEISNPDITRPDTQTPEIDLPDSDSPEIEFPHKEPAEPKLPEEAPEQIPDELPLPDVEEPEELPPAPPADIPATEPAEIPDVPEQQVPFTPQQQVPFTPQQEVPFIPERDDDSAPVDFISDAPDDSPYKSSDDDFASLLDDAVAEASEDSTSLDELLENIDDENADDDDDADDDFLIHDDMEPGNALADLIGEEKKAPTDTDDSLLENLEDLVSDDYSDILASTPDEHDDSQYEDKWALDLINQEPETPSTKDDLTAPDLDTIEAFEQGEEFSFTDIHNRNSGKQSTSEVNLPGGMETASHDEGYTDDYYDSYADDTEEDLIAEPDPIVEEIAYPDTFQASSTTQNSSETDFAGFTDAQYETETLDGNLNFSQGINLDIPTAELDPLELEQQKPSNYTGLWSIGAAIMIVVAVAQIGWFRMDTLAKNEQLRPVYTAVCDLAGCQLPGIQDTSLIRAANTVFNPHRSIADALVIDTLLTNSAGYAQPYPDLELEFRDLNDRIVAQRTFSPEEYLAGDVMPGDLMPSRVPVHIAIEVINPGPEAVSRQIYIRPNQ